MIDDERARDEVTREFFAYEAALVAGDHRALDEWFLPDPRVVRYGVADAQYGAAAVAEWRRRSLAVGTDRCVRNVHVLVVAPGAVVVAAEFARASDARLTGRQSQVWIERGGRWRIAHAHVSVVDRAAPVTGRPASAGAWWSATGQPADR